MPQSQWTAVATTDASGNLSLTFPTIAVNTEWTGIVSVPLAPNTAELFVVVNDVTVSSLGGSSSYGPIQLTSSDVLKITGSGLADSTQYIGVLIGTIAYGTSPPVTPVPTAAAVQASLTGAIDAFTQAAPPGVLFGPFTNGVSFGIDAVVPLAANTHTLTILATTGSSVAGATIKVVGNQSGEVYRPLLPPYLVAGFNQEAVVNVNPAIDSSVTVSVPAIMGASWTMTVYGDSDIFPESTFYTGSPKFLSTAATSTFLSSFNCRLLSAQVSSAAASSTAQLTIGGTGVLRVDTPSTAYPVSESFDWGPEGLQLFNATLGASITGSGFVAIAYAYP